MPSEDRIFGWIEDLVGIGCRRTGTPEGKAVAAYVKYQFESLGLEDVHYETASSWNWQLTSHGLGIDGKPIDSYPTAHSFVTPDEPSSFSTGPNGLTAEIVDVGLGTSLDMALQDVEGKIALFDLKFLLPPVGFAAFMEFLWDPGLTIVEPSFFVGNPFITSYETFAEAAMEAGAAGFVGVLADYFESKKYHNEFYRRTDLTIPGVWVSPAEGERIRAMMASAEAPSTAKLELHGSREGADLQGHIICPIGLMPTDAGFICASGVPTASLIAGPNYLNDGADTLDKVYRQDLVPVTKTFVELIDAIDETPSDLIGVPIVPDLLSDLLFDFLAED